MQERVKCLIYIVCSILQKEFLPFAFYQIHSVIQGNNTYGKDNQLIFYTLLLWLYESVWELHHQSLSLLQFLLATRNVVLHRCVFYRVQ